MTAPSTSQSNNSTFWGIILAIVLVALLALLTAIGTIGLALFLPIMVLLGAALAASLWVASRRPHSID